MPQSNELNLGNEPAISAVLTPMYPRKFYDLMHIGQERAHRSLEPRHVCKRRGETRKHLQFGTARYIGGNDPELLDNPRRTVDPSKYAFDARMETGAEAEMFFSVNEVDGWRKGERLRAVHGWWLDIDAKLEKPLLGNTQRENAILEDILKVLELSGLPMPHAFVNTRSGGWHIYWLVNPIYRAPEAKTPLVKEWKKVAQKIQRKFNSAKALLANRKQLNPDPALEFQVDGTASTDVVRLMRLAGGVRFAKVDSKNGGRYRDTSRGYGIIPYSHVDSPKERYDYAQFCEGMGVEADAQNHQEALSHKKIEGKTEPLDLSEKQDKPAPVVQPKPKVEPLFTKPQTGSNKHWRAAYELLTTWMTKKGHVPKGKRDLTAFVIYNCLLRRMPIERARVAIQRLNNKHIGLESDRLDNAQTVSEQPCSTGKRRYRYNYSASGLGLLLDKEFPFLNARSNPAFKTTKKSVRSNMTDKQRRRAEAAEYEAKAAAGKATAKKKKVSTLHQRLLPAVRQILDRGDKLTQIAVAQEAGYKSRATVARHWTAILAFEAGSITRSKSKQTESIQIPEPLLLQASGGDVSFASGGYTPPKQNLGCKSIKLKPPI